MEKERPIMLLRLKRSNIGFHLIKIAALVAIVALAGVAVPAQRPHGAPMGTLRIGWTSPTSLDPAKYNDALDISIGVAVYDYLITLDQKSNLVPGLAKEWKASADNKEYTLTLQSGVKFHDGSDFSSADVKFTFERLQKKDISNVSELFGGIASIETPDKMTVKF